MWTSCNGGAQPYQSGPGVPGRGLWVASEYLFLVAKGRAAGLVNGWLFSCFVVNFAPSYQMKNYI